MVNGAEGDPIPFGIREPVHVAPRLKDKWSPGPYAWELASVSVVQGYCLLPSPGAVAEQST